MHLKKRANALDYRVNLLYFRLDSSEQAISPVAKRTTNGEHIIPSVVIERRYFRGIANLLKLYMPICDEWAIVDNMGLRPEVIVKKSDVGKAIFNDAFWNAIEKQSYERN